MGGVGSPQHTKFKNLCFTGLTTLRKNANLIINLVALMVDANIPDIKIEPDKAVAKVSFIVLGFCFSCLGRGLMFGCRCKINSC